jgi:hypothetical protein
MERCGRPLCFILTLLMIACAMVLTFDGDRVERHRPASESFQRLAGGLGFGPATDLSNSFEFDPRLDSCGSVEVGPFRGGKEHGVLLCRPELHRSATDRESQSIQGEGDAPSP